MSKTCQIRWSTYLRQIQNESQEENNIHRHANSCKAFHYKKNTQKLSKINTPNEMPETS